MNKQNNEGRLDTFESYQDHSYQLYKDSNKDIFQDEFANASETTNEHYSESRLTFSKLNLLIPV